MQLVSGLFCAELWKASYVSNKSMALLLLLRHSHSQMQLLCKENKLQFQRGEVEEHQQHGGLGHSGHQRCIQVSEW